MKISILTQLKLVAPNLYRHTGNLTYYAIKKVDGRKKVHCLDTADRKTADRKLVQWLGELQMNTPGASGNSDMTVGQVLTAFALARRSPRKSRSLASQKRCRRLSMRKVRA